MALTPPLIINAPEVTPRVFGLFSVVAFPATPADPHWQGGGILWQGGACIGGVRGIGAWDCAEAEGEQPAVGLPKDLDSEISEGSGTPFTLYAPFACSPVGTSPQDAQDAASRTLLAGEEAAAENAFWTGDLGNVPNLSGANGYAAPTDLGAFDAPHEALAAVEAGLAATIVGRGVIHVPVRLAAILLAKGGLRAAQGKVTTDLGTPVVVGAGYPDVLQIVGTPEIVGLRSEVFISSHVAGDLFDRGTNTMHAIAERSYVLGMADCGLVSATVTSPEVTP